MGRISGAGGLMVEYSPKDLRPYAGAIDTRVQWVPRSSPGLLPMLEEASFSVFVATSRYFRERACDLRGPSRTQHLTYARQIGMHVARAIAGASLMQVGKRFGRDHTTVHHAVWKITAQIAEGNARTIADVGAVTAIAINRNPRIGKHQPA